MTKYTNFTVYSDHVLGDVQTYRLVNLPSTLAPTAGSWSLIRGLYDVLSRMTDGSPRVSVLEVGCGSGIVSLALARSRFVQQVVCLDKNPTLRRAVTLNAALNGNDEVGRPLTDKIHYTESDLYERLLESGYRFDWIVSNPPQRPSMVALSQSRLPIAKRNLATEACGPDRAAPQSTEGLRSQLGRALFKYHVQDEKDDDGLDFTRALLRMGKMLLKPGGRFYVQIAGWADCDALVSPVFQDLSLRPSIVESSRTAQRLDEDFDYADFVAHEKLTGIPYRFFEFEDCKDAIEAATAQERNSQGKQVWVEFMTVEGETVTRIPTPTDEMTQLIQDVYALGNLQSIQSLPGGAFDDLYIVQSDRGRFVLRKNGYRRGLDEIVFGEDFVVHLMDGGIPISALVHTRSGEYHVEQPQGQFYLLYECVEGRQYVGEQFNKAKILETGYFVASAQMVLAHAQLRGQPTPQNHPLPDKLNSQSRQQMLRDAEKELASRRAEFAADAEKSDFLDDLLAPGQVEYLIEQLHRLAANLRVLGYESAPRVPIFDYLYPDNLFFIGNALNGIVDLNYACSDVVASELAGWTMGPTLDLQQKRTQIWAINRRFKEKGFPTLSHDDLKFLPEMLRARFLREVLLRVERLWKTPLDRALPALHSRSFENLQKVDEIDWAQFLEERLMEEI